MTGRASGVRRRTRAVLLPVAGLALFAAFYFGFSTLRVGHAYDGTPEEIVGSMLDDIRADIEAENWAGLGRYGVSTFLSWHDEAELREYVEQELGNEAIGPVDYILVGEPSDISSTGKEIRFVLLEPGSSTTCRVVLKKSLGFWHVKDIHDLGAVVSQRSAAR